MSEPTSRKLLLYGFRNRRPHGFPTDVAVAGGVTARGWANFIGNKALVGALLSRLRHQCHTVKIDGPSLRDEAG